MSTKRTSSLEFPSSDRWLWMVIGYDQLAVDLIDCLTDEVSLENGATKLGCIQIRRLECCVRISILKTSVLHQSKDAFLSTF